jgi:ribosomal protein S12 methylthiotransferase accessory factor
MNFTRCEITYTDATHRVVPPEETLAAIEHMMPSVGITEVRDITPLDRVGIPVFLAMGRIEGAAALFKGKGPNATEAKVSAMMEAVERYCSTLDRDAITVGPASLLKGPAISPSSLILPNPYAYSEGMSLGWVPVTNIVNNMDMYVPANAVYHPYPMDMGWLFRSNTNGMASGNCTEEAILHALCEVIERDAWSLAELAPRVAFNLDYDGDDATILGMLEAFSDAQVEITLKDITSDIGVPTFVAMADDVLTRDPTLLTIGVGTHLSPRIALIRALTEVAQSRLSQIYENENNPSAAAMKRGMGYDRLKAMNSKWFTQSKNTIRFSDVPSHATSYVLDDIFTILDALCSRSLSTVAVADLTRKDIGIPVVRVIVPGLEQCTMDKDRVGPRARALMV